MLEISRKYTYLPEVVVSFAGSSTTRAARHKMETKLGAEFMTSVSYRPEVIISSLIIRSDNPEFANMVKETNVALKLKCEENNWSFIDNSNINSLHLNRRGLHLTHEGSALLQANPRADGAKRRARVLIPPGYLHPGKRKH